MRDGVDEAQELAVGDVVQGRQRVGGEDDLGAPLQQVAHEREDAEANVEARVVHKDDGAPVGRSAVEAGEEELRVVQVRRPQHGGAGGLKGQRPRLELGHHRVRAPVEHVAGQQAKDELLLPPAGRERVQRRQHGGQVSQRLGVLPALERRHRIGRHVLVQELQVKQQAHVSTSEGEERTPSDAEEGAPERGGSNGPARECPGATARTEGQTPRARRAAAAVPPETR